MSPTTRSVSAAVASAPSAAWAAVLDELEAHVHAAWALLDHDGAVDLAAVVAWAPPHDLGPCPAPLRERAATVLRTQAELEEGLARRMAMVAREAQGSRRATPALPPRARVLDQRA